MKKALNYLFIIFFLSNANAQVDKPILIQLIVNQTNKYRKNLNIDTLITDDTLIKIAEYHSIYMSNKNKLTHYNTIKKFRTPSDRLNSEGYIYSYNSENIAFVDIDITNVSNINQLIANQAMDMWLNSKPHLKNITNPKSREIGVGIAVKNMGNNIIRVYITQDFGARLD